MFTLMDRLATEIRIKTSFKKIVKAFEKHELCALALFVSLKLLCLNGQNEIIQDIILPFSFSNSIRLDKNVFSCIGWHSNLPSLSFIQNLDLKSIKTNISLKTANFIKNYTQNQKPKTCYVRFAFISIAFKLF